MLFFTEQMGGVGRDGVDQVAHLLATLVIFYVFIVRPI